MPDPAVVGHPVGRDVVAGGVQGIPAVEEQHLRRHDACLRVICKGLDDGGDPIGMSLRVVVEQDEDLA